MVALYIILGILLFLLLLTLLPVRVDVRFREEFVLKVSYAFLRFKILPGEEKPEEEKEEKKPQKEKPEKEKGEGAVPKLKRIVKRKGFSGFLESLFELIGMVFHAGKNIVFGVKVKRFDLYLCLGGHDDPAAAAQLYGKLCGPVYAACAELFALTGAPRRRKPKKAVTVDLDYGSSENLVDFSARVSFLPFTILKEGLALLVHGLPVALGLLRAAKAPKQAQQPEQTYQTKGESS